MTLSQLSDLLSDPDTQTHTHKYRHTFSFLANVNSRSRLLYVIGRPSVVCLSVVCNVRAPYSGD